MSTVDMFEGLLHSMASDRAIRVMTLQGAMHVMIKSAFKLQHIVSQASIFGGDEVNEDSRFRMMCEKMVSTPTCISCYRRTTADREQWF